ncbi:hypothetical protein ACFQLX_01395 [Streptomyces polyrhachis]|uniref:Uncharacterized protein n=1 Tax=Streptomyces polyrhachis TaxID=1282885 RepID=A0ABW2G7S1_9ACTN
MEENEKQQRAAVHHPGYPLGQLARAFATALSHEDADTRRRAEERVRRWQGVLAGLDDRTLTVGSRTPVAGLPAWVTLEVMRGGFATGAARAGGPLEPDEVEAARRAGVAAERGALFAYHLTEAGLAELDALLESRCYEVRVPEEAALLTVAWLVRSGDRLGALRLLEVLEPFADRLRFTPRPSPHPAPDAGSACRRTVGETRQAVAGRRPNRAVEAMNEALAVWNPFADELLQHWWETTESGRVLARIPGPDWLRRGTAFLRRYERLAAIHTHCAKPHRPKENLAILRVALEEVVAGRSLDTRRRGLLQYAVDSMLRRRGLPGSLEHTALRDRQAADAARPTHHALAQLMVRRLSALPQQQGVPRIEPLIAPVTDQEQNDTGLPAGTAVPAPIRRVVERALSAPIGTLIERGVVPSGEVLAELVPQLVASTTASPYPDPALRALTAANYRAYRNRRSLLLHNLERQVRVEELPWIQAVAAHRHVTDSTRTNSRSALRQLGGWPCRASPPHSCPTRSSANWARSPAVPAWTSRSWRSWPRTSSWGRSPPSTSKPRRSPAPSSVGRSTSATTTSTTQRSWRWTTPHRTAASAPVPQPPSPNCATHVPARRRAGRRLPTAW